MMLFFPGKSVMMPYAILYVALFVPIGVVCGGTSGHGKHHWSSMIALKAIKHGFSFTKHVTTSHFK